MIRSNQPPRPPTGTGEVVAFPTLRCATSPQALSQLANQRLARALAGLGVALDEQRAALAAWRGALVDLKSAVGDLGSSLQSYTGSLGDLKEGVAGLHEQALHQKDGAGAAPPP